MRRHLFHLSFSLTCASVAMTSTQNIGLKAKKLETSFAHVTDVLALILRHETHRTLFCGPRVGCASRFRCLFFQRLLVDDLVRETPGEFNVRSFHHVSWQEAQRYRRGFH